MGSVHKRSGDHAGARGVGDGRPVVLVLIGAFWPEHDATGPNQSLRGLATALGQEYEFKVVSRDRPFGGGDILAPNGRWIDRGFATFRYCAIAPAGWARGLAGILRETPYDLLMMNGFFDREFTLPTLMLRRFGRVPRRPAIVSTRGEFASGALGLKYGRKGAYLQLARRLGLLSDVWLHATGQREAQDIETGFPFSRGVLVAPNVRTLGPLPLALGEAHGEPRPFRLAFLGRVSRVKNIDYALRVLASVTVPVQFDIYGPVEDAALEQECHQIIAGLPANAGVSWKGAIANEAVPDTLAAYDLLFLPTRGENFGHAILDALSVGVPVLISDQTPFQKLDEIGAGWSLPLANPAAFVRVIEDASGMTPGARGRLREAARRLAERVVRESNAVAANRGLLRNVLGDPALEDAKVSALL